MNGVARVGEHFPAGRQVPDLHQLVHTDGGQVLAVGMERDTDHMAVVRIFDGSFLEAAQAGMKDWWQLMEKQATRNNKPMKPQVVAWELGKRLRDDAIVSCDCGTVATWWARLIRARRGQMFSISGTLASMANGMPYTIAAQIAYPDRQCVAFVGDGGFSMLMAEFIT